FFIFPVKIKYLALAAAGIALFYTVVPAEPGMAHAAHLGGMIMSWIFVRKILPGGWLRIPDVLRPSEKSEPRRAKSQPEEPKEDAAFLQNQVDAILDKITASGMKSLTKREREILESARKKMTKP
ncbi:MAG TPA: DUF6576 domain-containing protein, partial [Verrucomicrobiae bacterium]|nr:DUF6576 domain-containing protein [Verrucomicrobiae bacterium]